MNYTILDVKTHSYLSELVHDVYNLTSEKEFVYTTAPNCEIGLSIIMSGNAYIFKDQEWIRLPKVHIYGLTNRPFVLKTSDHYNEICIGFTPYHFQLFHQTKMEYLTGGNVTDAYEVFNKDNLDRLIEALSSHKNMYTHLNCFLAEELIQKKENNLFRHIFSEIETKQINNIHHLSQHIGFSSTYIRNYFRENVGLSPKQFIQTMRIHRVLNAKKTSFRNLTELGLQFGYYDQAHFTKDFKSVIGICPQQYFVSDQLVNDFHQLHRWQNDPFGLSQAV